SLIPFVNSGRLVIVDNGPVSETVIADEYSNVEARVMQGKRWALVGRNVSVAKLNAGEKIKERMKAGEQFTVAFADFDNLTAYHRAFGRHFQLAGKIRLVIEDIIRDLPDSYAGAKIDQIRAGGDESVLVIRGVNAETAYAILEDIRRGVARDSLNRLALAEVENLSGSDHRYFSQIRAILGQDLISRNGKFYFMFDIRQPYSAQESLERALSEINTTLLREAGMELRAHIHEIIPLFTLSIGARYYQPSGTDVEIAYKELMGNLSSLVRQSKQVGGFTTTFEGLSKQVVYGRESVNAQSKPVVDYQGRDYPL
ncbi:MAG: hypothetical protein PHS64_00360, partial [Candidatus Omnitrophica bacterium]|nr:hypothetical protein [Candidatus Omnitrophota bacterium]